MKFKIVNRIFFLLICVSGSNVLSANAQTQSIPGSADPGRLMEQLYIHQPDKTDGDIVPPKPISLDDEIPSASEGFVLNGILLQGVTVFDEGAFDSLIAEYVGRKVDLPVLQHLAMRITKRYRQEGYFLSRVLIPQQEVVDRTVRLRIIEGRVGKVIVDDPENLLVQDFLDVMGKTVRNIKELQVLHGPTLERYMLLLNDQSGMRIQNLLKASKEADEPGVVDIILEVRPKKSYSFMTTYSNDGSRFVGPHQVNMIASKGHVINSFDQLNLQGSFAIPLREVRFGALDYSLPLTEEGLTGSISFSYAKSEPGLSLRALEVEGDSLTFETGISFPVIRSRGENFNIGTLFTFKQSATEFLDEELIDDKTRAISIFGNYQAQDKWDGMNVLTGSFSKGFDILNATETGSPNLSRTQGRSDFFKAEMMASRQQDLGFGLRLINAVNGQYAPHPLLSSEEFGYGGTQFGRAYDPSEITGDQGLATSVEVLYTDIDPLPKIDMKVVPFTFYDVGKVWNHDRDSKPQSAASAGFGAYYDYDRSIHGSVQIAYPLTRPVATPVMNGEDGPRILFTLTAGF